MERATIMRDTVPFLLISKTSLVSKKSAKGKGEKTMSAPSDTIRNIHDVGETREAILLVDATGSGGSTVIPKESVVYVNRHFAQTTLIQWNGSYFEIPGDTPVLPYFERPEEPFLPIS